ncbi:MAG: hypothetical protein WBM90_01345, partial [Acidimicrobiia bacterium]
MRHRAVVTLIVFMLSLISAPLGAIGQEQPNPVEILIDAFSTPQGRLFAAQFLREPLPGKSTVADETGDFEHSSGQQPGYTPDHIDILSTWALQFHGGPLEQDIFGPTDQSSLWATTGQMTVEPPNHDAFLTFSGDQPHDGSQYDQGAILFGFSLAGTPMPPMPGRCEYVVWINDLSRGPTFANLPAFPGDPAAGTNLAFGLGLNPDDQGPTSTFALEYQKGSGFVSNPAIDVRSFITTDYVGVFVPSGQIGQMSDVNFYTFCMEEGFTFEPEMTGADQTGLIALTSEDLGQLAIVEVVSSTTTTTEPTSSTTSEPATSTTSGSDEDAPTTDGSGFPWWLVMIGGGISVAIVGWWLFNQEDDPCRELLEAWMAAQKQCDYLEDLAEQAANDCEEAELELEDLEQERRDACNLWPPACWETEEGASMEDDRGNRITSRDVHMRKMALGDIWDDYKAGKLSALEIEAKWREIDTPEFREELRDTDTAAKELVAEIDADIETTRQRADEACERAINSRQKADDACARSDEARKAYEDCVTKAEAISAASTSPSASEDPTSGTATGAGNEPSSTSPQKDPCDGVQPKR